MVESQTALPTNYQAIIERFVDVCRADDRVIAAFLGGSYARGAADAYSDLDLGLITTDAAYDDFVAQLKVFVHQLGDPLLLESFSLPFVVFFILANGAECELAVGRESDFSAIHGGPHNILLDKTGILQGYTFPHHRADPADQIEVLRDQIYVFWHDLSHFITAMARGQLWWAHGQLEILRLMCITLALLDHDFSAHAEGYEKLEKAIPLEKLAALESTFCALEYNAMLQAGLTLVGFYREIASKLAEQHGLRYPEKLEQIMLDRLEHLPAVQKP
jgi:predicted nucleotidyltransferase